MPTRPKESKPGRVAVGYVRVSTDEQAREGVSIQVQSSRIRAYAEAKGFAIDDVVADEGRSGKNLDRPGLRELLKRCDRGEVGHVIVWRLDRLTRRTRHLLSLVEDLFLTRKIELHSVSESLDTSTPHGRFVLTLLGGLAQMERELIGDRTRAAMAYKRQQQHPTSHPPLGFRANGAGKPMVVMPGEVAVVRLILRQWQAGGSFAGIARKLNQDAVSTKRGGRWHASTVRAVVQRRENYRSVLAAS